MYSFYFMNLNGISILFLYRFHALSTDFCTFPDNSKAIFLPFYTIFAFLHPIFDVFSPYLKPISQNSVGFGQCRVFGTYLLQFQSSLPLISCNIWYQSEKRKSGFLIKKLNIKGCGFVRHPILKLAVTKKCLNSFFHKHAQRQLQLISSPKINFF